MSEATLVLTAKGFRPFFLLGGLFAAAIVPLWLLVLTGRFAPAGPLTGMVWHAHEMLYGFTVAIVAGFLLTAVGNWTQRETVVGPWLAALTMLWAAGRVALLAMPGWGASVVDLAFLPALAIGVGRPLWLSGNRRNAAFPVLLALLWGANLAVHLDAHGVWPGVAVAANRFAVHLVVVIILVVAGRIVPMFTRNTTGVATIRSLPALDWTAIVGTATVAALQWRPDSPLLPVAAGIAAIAVAGRAWHWGARHTLREPLLWVLHVGHAWIAVGLALQALAPVVPIAPSLALHAITVGAIGMLTLGMMARVSLGHTGRPLRIRPAVGVAFAALLLVALVRVLGPLLAPALTVQWLWVSGLLWAAAFGAYTVVYTPILLAPRPDGRPG